MAVVVGFYNFMSGAAYFWLTNRQSESEKIAETTKFNTTSTQASELFLRPFCYNQ